MLRRNFFGKLANIFSTTAIAAAIPIKEKKLIYSEYIKGFQFNEGKPFLSELKKGDTLLMQREPENDYDENAVALYWNNKKIGYLPVMENVSISTMLDQNIALTCTIEEVNVKGPLWEAVRIGVWI